MRLIKRDPWKAVDIELVNYLNIAKNHWRRQHDELTATASDDVVLRDQSTTRIRDWTAEIEKCKADLKMYDCDAVYNLVPYNTRDSVNKLTRVVNFATFQKNKGTFKITEPITPFFVKTQPRSDADDAYWTSYTETPTSWTGNFEAKWRKIPSLNAQSYTYNRHYYKDSIIEIEGRKRHLEIALVGEQMALLKLEKRGSDKDDPRFKELSTCLSKCEEWITRLKSDEGDLKKGFTPAASERYAKGAAAIGLHDLFQMIGEDDEDFEAALRSIKKLLTRGVQA
jgi:hypothetical protein